MNTFAFDASLHNNKKLKRSKQLLDGCSEIYKKLRQRNGMVSSAAERLVDSVFADLGLDVVKVARRVFRDVALRRGFQQSNCDNQFEHFSSLYLNREARAGDDALVSLHVDLTANYAKWMSMVLETASNCSPCGRYEMIRDIALVLLIWGESANLRHCPEFLSYAFHRLLARERMSLRDASFLDLAIKPLYDIISVEMTAKQKNGNLLPHSERRNYDDFNEFFWKKECADVPLEDLPSRIRDHDKTFFEWRTWLRPVHVFSRIIGFYTIALQLLICTAFREHGVGPTEYLLIAPTHALLCASNFLYQVCLMEGAYSVFFFL